MASVSSNDTEITSMFSSSLGEHRWVHQMEKKFEKELKIDIKCDLPCISRVPQTLRAEKPEAYAPKRIGLGPYHHFRPELYDHMEMEKLSAVKKVVTADRIAQFRQLIVGKLVELEPSARACYGDYLDLEGHTLAWIWAIDGLFLHHHLGVQVPVDCAFKSVLAQDIFMLENQIPILLFEEIDGVIDQFQLSDKVVRDFCVAHSPLKWTNKPGPDCVERTPAHLLDCLYHLVVNDGNIRLKVGKKKKEKRNQLEDARMEAAECYPREAAEFYSTEAEEVQMAAAEVAGTTISDLQNMSKPIIDFLKQKRTTSVAQNTKAIIDLIKQLQLDKNCFPLFQSHNTAVEMEIPSVSSLQKNAGVKFAIAKEGIRGIKFYEETRTLNLPEITLKDNSEVILRNLVAYEALVLPAGSKRELAEYIDLMCGIIDTAEDVKILQEQKIIVIKDNLSHDQITNIFNGITKFINKQSELAGKVNKHYDSKLIVKAGRFVKQCLDSSWNFVKGSWKVLCFFYSLILISVLILQAFCNIYGCSWGQRQNFILRMAE
ncbi:unnamed protein product [Ilex paraguariensis]|uniref:Uncharacterized protein n=1 Tax=Ilex paraguariensis TaxID=185542 RepID=A0ABC8RV87_9AQUA